MLLDTLGASLLGGYMLPEKQVTRAGKETIKGTIRACEGTLRTGEESNSTGQDF